MTTRPVVNSIRHQGQTRPNIPTEELRDFVAEAEEAPTTLLYPRDPSLDPQLVWKGKDEQDREDLAVPVVPIYIQEKIHPEALIQGLAASAKAAAAGGTIAEEEIAYQIDLFNDFDDFGDDFVRKVDFYEHDQQWTKREVKDGKAEDLTRQLEQVRAFRDTWKLGIHSYLAYLRDRITMFHDLLTESGSVFVQIGVENVHLVRALMDEVFGSKNFLGLITFKKTHHQESVLLPSIADYIVWYGRDKARVKYRPLHRLRTNLDVDYEKYRKAELPNGTVRLLTKIERADPSLIPTDNRPFRDDITMTQDGEATEGQVPYEVEGKTYYPGSGRHWRTAAKGRGVLKQIGRVVGGKDRPFFKAYWDDTQAGPINNIWTDVAGTQDKIFVVQTNDRVISRCILMTTDPGDLVLDPTCGSGTTAYVAEQWGRRWITIDTSRVALALARTRLMAAKFPYYLLADSPAGLKKEADLSGVVPPPAPTLSDIRKGFVYKRVPHVTLKSIANNPDIREGMTRDEIDAAIARHAESETLYDQPYADPKRVRVSGPFTMESLSPHRVLSAADDDLDGVVTADERVEQRDFTTMILDNLRAAGAQNTIKQERLRFDRLDTFPGLWIQGTGEYTDAEGISRRVAVSIGPEHGTVGARQVKEAAKEAVQGVGFDLLLVCGFAFDASVTEEAKRYGTLTVLPTRMNPDLAMGDDLLKKTGAGNLFMVFGEPDIEIDSTTDGQIVVELRGVDVYDPTTGDLRSNSTDDIACWFIDTDYDGEAFFVRHAYFTGAGEPYEKLKKALRAEIDEGAWAALYSTTSRPFPRPASGEIAVKAINHYGDEVLKVFRV